MWPLCPHCESRLDEIEARVVRTKGRSSPEFGFGKRDIYACPACRRAPGLSHRKGFWAGSPGEVPDQGAGCQRDGPVSLLSTISVATVFSDSRQSV